MSLLEDVFLQDEANEAEDLERIIEGDEFGEPVGGDDDDERGEDEAEEDKRHVDPSQAKPKRVVKNPRIVLNPARLTGPRGIQVIPEHFKNFKFKGKGHEKEDLDLFMKKMEHWAYRLYPKFQFEDCLKKIETLAKKAPVMVHLRKIRSDQLLTDDIVVQKDSSDDETEPAAPQEDEFDKLLQQQIDLARATPAPGSVKKGFRTPGDLGTPLSMPKATSSPSISDEQKQRMLRNKQLAEQRRLARLKNNMDNNSPVNMVVIEEDNENDVKIDLTKELNKNTFERINNKENIDLTEEVDEVVYENNDDIETDLTEEIKTVKSRRNIIDSSDEEENTPELKKKGLGRINYEENIELTEDINEVINKKNEEINIDSSDEDLTLNIIQDVHSKEPTEQDIIEAEKNFSGDENDDIMEIENENMKHFPIKVKVEKTDTEKAKPNITDDHFDDSEATSNITDTTNNSKDKVANEITKLGNVNIIKEVKTIDSDKDSLPVKNKYVVVDSNKDKAYSKENYMSENNKDQSKADVDEEVMDVDFNDKC